MSTQDKTKNFTGSGDRIKSSKPVQVNEGQADYHDIIVIGASAGGIEALQRLTRNLPAGLPAAVFIVVHTSPESPGLLPTILNGVSSLPVSYPRDSEIIEEGHIYVAPPNYHLLLEQGIIRVARGPKENRHRPAIDPLFRSAARQYGSRVIGVILTGTMDDGTFGLLTVKKQGGLAVIQDPADAVCPDMPLSAIRRVPQIDYVVPLAEIGPLLSKLTQEVATFPQNEDSPVISEQLKIEDEFAMSNIPGGEVLNKIGKPASIACPDCHGTLWEINNNGLLRFRCRVGHSYTAQGLLEEHSETLESALWAALRTLEESASINRRLVERAKNDNNLLSASRFMESAVQTEQQAELIKRVLNTNKAIDEQTKS